MILRLALVASLASASALADDQKDLVPDAVDKKAPEVDVGWKWRASIGATFSLAHSKEVVGAQDGSTINLGPGFDVGLDYLGVEHEWRNSLGFRLVVTQTPAIDEFVKTADSLTFESIYLWHSPGTPWVGPFAQFQLSTAVLQGEDVRAQDVTYALPDGTARTQARLKLTEIFAPMTLKESVGAFLAPYTTPHAKVEIRLGVGARETFTQEGLALSDDAATPNVEVIQLEDFVQVGGEAFAGVSGAFPLEAVTINYALGAETLLPFYSSTGDDKDFADKVVFNLDFKLGVRVFSFMSLDYNFKAVREPLLVDELQLQNNLLLNFTYVLVDG